MHITITNHTATTEGFRFLEFDAEPQHAAMLLRAYSGFASRDSVTYRVFHAPRQCGLCAVWEGQADTLACYSWIDREVEAQGK